METIKVTTKLTNEERETVLVYDSITKMWTMDSTVPKHFRKAQKQGWTPITQLVGNDGMVCGMVLTASDRAITIRNTAKKQMSEKQMGNLLVDDEEEE
jgi:hypothetical protein